MIKKPLVITAGQLEQLQSGDVLAPIPTTLELINGENFSILPGNPVFIDTANTAKYANAEDNKDAIALCTEEVLSSASGIFQVDGILSLITGQWDAVTGATGGLTPGAVYFLDDIDVARITKVAPTTTGHYIVRVGIAINSTDLKIAIGTPIKL